MPRWPSIPLRALAERFWEKVDKNGPTIRTELGPCWIWTAYIGAQGYGKINLGARGEGIETAPRVSWELHNGPVPDGKLVCHRCDYRPCVRPDHLFLGNYKANVDDMISKGRIARGEMRASKLKETDVIDIRTLAAFGADIRVLAEVFEISRRYVRDLLTHKRWRHVP